MLHRDDIEFLGGLHQELFEMFEQVKDSKVKHELQAKLMSVVSLHLERYRQVNSKCGVHQETRDFTGVKDKIQKAENELLNYYKELK